MGQTDRGLDDRLMLHAYQLIEAVISLLHDAANVMIIYC